MTDISIRTVAFTVGLALCMTLPLPTSSWAGYDASGTSKTKKAPLCTFGPEQQSSITLHRTDNEQLELARAFTHYLDEKGQDSRVIHSIYKASLQSGVDFELLLLKAIMESDLGRVTVAKHSSARGVFQYIEPTWLILMNRYGADIGYPEYAEAVTIGKRTGIPYFKGPNKHLRPEILALRHDPNISALVKAHQIKEETEVIQSFKGGKNVTATDHYIAHMMGLSLAKEFYDLKRKNSIIAVARLNRPEMREAAKLNKPFFYKGKHPLTAAESYKQFEKRVARELKNIRHVSKLNPEVICTAKAE